MVLVLSDCFSPFGGAGPKHGFQILACYRYVTRSTIGEPATPAITYMNHSSNDNNHNNNNNNNNDINEHNQNSNDHENK